MSDLVKVYNAIGNYREALRKYENIMQAQSARRLQKWADRPKQESEYNSQWRALQAKRKDILATLASQQVGRVRSTWLRVPPIEYQGAQYSTESASTIEVLVAVDQEIARLNESNMIQSRGLHRIRELEPTGPTAETSLTIGGAKFRVSLNQFKTKEVERLIEKRKAEEREKSRASTEVIESLKARAAINEQQRRRQAQKHRKEFAAFAAQITVVPHCPYCFGPLGLPEAHIDHIYPIVKGGHSSRGNLVFVCAACNMKKQKMTIRSFAKKYRLDYNAISQNLELLGKDF